MLEILKLIIEKILSFENISKIIEIKNKTNTKNYGLQLFIFYNKMNNIYIIAEKIVDKIDEIINMKELADIPGYGVSHEFDNLRKLIKLQIRNVQEFWDEYEKNKEMIHLLDRDSYRKINSFFDPKLGLLRNIEKCLRPAEQRISISPSVAEYFSYELKFSELMSNSLEKHGDYIILRNVFRKEFIENSQPPYSADLERNLTSNLPSIAIITLEKYRKEREPRKQLEYFKESLESLYNAIKSNFSVSDLLVSVGDRKSKKVIR